MKVFVHSLPATYRTKDHYLCTHMACFSGQGSRIQRMTWATVKLHIPGHPFDCGDDGFQSRGERQESELLASSFLVNEFLWAIRSTSCVGASVVGFRKKHGGTRTSDWLDSTTKSKFSTLTSLQSTTANFWSQLRRRYCKWAQGTQHCKYDESRKEL